MIKHDGLIDLILHFWTFKVDDYLEWVSVIPEGENIIDINKIKHKKLKYEPFLGFWNNLTLCNLTETPYLLHAFWSEGNIKGYLSN